MLDDSTVSHAKILVVDDDYMNIEVITSMLTNKQVKSDYATSGKQALDLMQQRIELVYRDEAKMYDIILLDYSMPEMDGPQVAIEIRRLFQNSILLDEDKVPFICCCTAYSEASFKRQALAAGMDHFLTKPVRSQDLDEILLLLASDE